MTSIYPEHRKVTWTVRTEHVLYIKSVTRTGKRTNPYKVNDIFLVSHHCFRNLFYFHPP